MNTNNNAQTTSASTFRVRSYSKQELALLYFPESLPHVATNHLTSWIKGCRQLHRELTALPAYNRHAKFYSAQQVRLITEYLGEP